WVLVLTSNFLLLTFNLRLLALRTSAHLSSGGSLLRGALGGLRFGGRRRLARGGVGLLAPAQPLGRGAQPPAYAFGLRLLGLALRLGLGFRARIELAADELDLGDLRAV